MRRWAWLLVVAACGGGSGSVTIQEYPQAFKDAFCRYATRCGEFPDIATCESANIGFNLHIDPSSLAAVDMNKVIFNGDLAGKCLDEYGAQSCDTTDQDGRTFADCSNVVSGTVGSGGTCAINAECKSGTCNVPTCSMACCQGTCMGDAKPAPGGPGTMCTSSTQCSTGNYCDFTAMTCAALKTAGSTCQSTTECAYGLGCAGSTMRTCKALPKLGEACPDAVCRDAGQYCDATSSTCMKVGLSGASCTTALACSSYYPCDTTAMKCTKGPTSGQACTTSQRCFDADTFCDTSAASPTCVMLRADGGACMSNSQCENNDCMLAGSAGTCTTPAVCI